MSAGDRDTLTDVELEVISWWGDGTYGCHHTEGVCPTPDECRGKYGLVAAVEQIVSDAVAARVRAAQAQALRDAAERYSVVYSKASAEAMMEVYGFLRDRADRLDAGDEFQNPED